jgi:hypothetical protein
MRWFANTCGPYAPFTDTNTTFPNTKEKMDHNFDD